MTLPPDPTLGLVDGPFQPRLSALSRKKAWYGWAGIRAPSEIESVEFEYFAIRNQATLFDISPMHKYRITGPDALRVLNRMVTRDLTRIADNRVAYALWCDEEGMVIDDGTLFRFGATDWRLCCQEPMLDWLCEAGRGFDVEIRDESHSIAGLALQGPTSFAVAQAAGWDIAHLKPFAMTEVEPGLLVSRTGFTGDLGYEIWCDRDAALPLWDRLWQAGEHHGLRAIGYAALNIARIEAGFVTAGVDFQPALAAERLHRGRTPFELNMGWQVHMEKGHFNGRRALLKARSTPRTLLMRMDVEGFKPAEGALVYWGKRREIGHVTSGIWSPTAKRNIALAEVAMPYAKRRPARFMTEIYTNEEGRWDRRMARLTPLDMPFFQPPRARATPPAFF
jgi:aminomethyltransferase